MLSKFVQFMYDLKYKVWPAITSFLPDLFVDVILPHFKLFMLYPFAKLGNVNAQNKMAYIYFTSWKLETQKGIKWLEHGVAVENPKSLIIRGIFYFNEGRSIHRQVLHPENRDVERDEDYYRRIDEEVRENFFKGIECFKKAAKLGDAEAYYNLYEKIEHFGGFMGTKESEMKYLKISAEKGYPYSQVEIAIKNLKKENFTKGFYWLKKAIDSPKRNWKKHSNFRSFERKEVINWYKKYKNIYLIKQKALKGDGEAMYQYSEYLIKENLVGYELNESHKWHSKSAKAGYLKALADEAWFIIRRWVDEPLEQAFKYFYQAAEQNDKEGFFGLGECYAYGWGVEKDFEKAKFYFTKAKGEKYSIERMKEIETESSEKVLEVIRDVYN